MHLRAENSWFGKRVEPGRGFSGSNPHQYRIPIKSMIYSFFGRSRFRRRSIPGHLRASFAHFHIHFSGSRYSGVLTQKYDLNRLILENPRFASDFILLFRGLRLVAFSATTFQVIGGEIGDGKGQYGPKIKSLRRRSLFKVNNQVQRGRADSPDYI